MKTNRWLFLLVFSLYLSSCGESHHLRTLQTIDSIADTHPDSAMSLLQQFKDSIRNAPEETQMFYHLLCIKAQDKAYIPHTSDSLITQILRYYRNKKDKRRLPIAYYYAGRVYRDLGDTPQALNLFQQAKDASEGSTDYKLLSLIYNQIGMIFLYQDIYDKAPEIFKKAYYYNTLARDSVGMVYRLRDIGRSYSTLKQADSAIYYYQKADKQAEHIKNSQLRATVNSELSGYYTELGKHKEAYKAMQIALSNKKTLDFYPLCSTIASYYEYTSQWDSATYYFSHLLNANSYIYIKEGYRGLYNIAKQQEKTDKALSLLEHHLAYSDSVQNINQAESIRKISALYDYQQSWKENKKLRRQFFHERKQKFFFSIAFIFSVLLLITYREYKKRKEQAQEIQRQKLERIKKEQYQSSLFQIEKNKKEIKTLELSLREAEVAQNQLQQDLLNAQKKLIEKNNEQIEARQIVQGQAEAKLKRTDIYKKFHGIEEEEGKKEKEKIEKAKITSSDWQELKQIIDETYNQFSQRLQELYPVTDIELQVCLLLKIGIAPREIASITIRSKQAISSIRKRLYRKLFNENGNTEQLDSFIRNF